MNQNKDTKRYSNSFKLLAGSRVTENRNKENCKTYLEELSLTGETVNLGISGDRIVYIDKIESKSTIKVGLISESAYPYVHRTPERHIYRLCLKRK